jgi:hypothetical protein
MMIRNDDRTIRRLFSMSLPVSAGGTIIEEFGFPGQCPRSSLVFLKANTHVAIIPVEKVPYEPLRDAD